MNIRAAIKQTQRQIDRASSAHVPVTLMDVLLILTALESKEDLTCKE